MSEMLLTAYNGSILGPIAKILGWLMDLIYDLMAMVGIENVALCTILFTIVIYTLLLPLTYKQQKFAKLSQKMQPELQAITKKYQGKKDQASMMAQQQETQAVYEKYGVSMMGSCGNMIVQMPILFALYRVFLNVPAYVGGVKEKYLTLATDIMNTKGYQDTMTALVTDNRILTQPSVDFTATDNVTLQNYVVDVLAKLNESGWESLADAFPSLSNTIDTTFEAVSHINALGPLSIANSPWYVIKNGFAAGEWLLIACALLVPIISYLTQVFSLKLSQASAGNNNGNDQMAQQMAMMNKTMPLLSLFMCFSVPVGLGIYWIASALVRIVQQFVLNKHFEKIDLDDIIEKNKEKAKKKREKMGIAENQISNAAHMNTRRMEDKKMTTTSDEKEALLEKASAAKSNAKPGSMAAKANMVRDFNERNNKKN